MTNPKPSGLETAARKGNSLWNDLGPALGFVLVYNVLLRVPDSAGLLGKEYALYWATGVLMLLAAFVVIRSLLKQERISPLMLISTAIIGGFGALGIIFQNKTIIYMKPTIVNLVYAGLIFGSMAVGRNIWKVLFKHVFDLPDFAWRSLAIRWGLFFIAMAVWNEFLWRTYSEAVWANWKIGNIFIVLAFALANTPYTLKHLREAAQADETA